MRPPSVVEIAPGLTGLRSVMVNLYLVASSSAPDAWVLVDAGLRGAGPRIIREAEKRFGANNPPRAILLTHGHFDHVGALPWLLRHWPAPPPIYAHPDELPFLNDHRQYPAPDPAVGGGLMAFSSPLYPRSPPRFPNVTVQALPLDGSVPALPSWQAVATPGHSPGHVSFWRPEDRLLIAGDALIGTRQESARAVWRQQPVVRPPPAYFTPNWPDAFRSMKRLQALSPDILASGHGPPLVGEQWRRDLDELLDRFPERGLPRHGRYVPAAWNNAAFA